MPDFIAGELLHGGDYNPEQWLHYPDIFDKDLALLKKASINTVTLGIFAWSALEPQEGVWNFVWMDRIIDKLHKNGIAVILATPSGSRPKWLSDKYPEVLRVDELRRRQLYGFRHNHCYTSPVYRQKVRAINMQLAQRYGNHPGVILWHLSNEYGGECHCELCQQAFRDWLRGRYKSIEELNKKWSTAFWSHTYNSFDQIESPSPIGEMFLHALKLDWKRFVTDRTADFIEAEIRALRDGGSQKPVTTNFMYNYPGLNYRRIAPSLDVISWDTYPLWHRAPEHLTAADNAMQHDFMRCLKMKPFLLMESCPTSTNWQSVSKLKRPGMLRAASLQAVAHGSDSVLYFQIRQSIGSSEKFHGAVIDHYGEADTRVFGEVTQVGESLKKLGEVCGSTMRAEVAVIYDTENRWALEDAQGPRNSGLSYKNHVLNCYYALCRQGVNIDIIDHAQAMDDYKLVVAPMSYMFHQGFSTRLRAYVAGGGRLVMTCHSGVVDGNDNCYLGGTPHDLMDVMGLRATEIDALYDGESNTVRMEADNCLGLQGEYRCDTICELVKLWTATPLGSYGGDFYAGSCAVAMNRFGMGEAYTISTLTEQRFMDDFFEALVRRAQVVRLLDAPLPEGLVVTMRENSEHQFLFLQNFTPHSMPLAGLPKDGMLLYAETEQKPLSELPPFGTLVVRTRIE